MLYGRAHRAAGLIRFFPRYASSASSGTVNRLPSVLTKTHWEPKRASAPYFCARIAVVEPIGIPVSTAAMAMCCDGKPSGFMRTIAIAGINRSRTADASTARPAEDMGLAGEIGVRQLYLALTLYGKVPNIVHIFRCYPIGWAATTGLLIVYYLLVRGSMDNGGTA